LKAKNNYLEANDGRYELGEDGFSKQATNAPSMLMYTPICGRKLLELPLIKQIPENQIPITSEVIITIFPGKK
jgi:hypothetical protein